MSCRAWLVALTPLVPALVAPGVGDVDQGEDLGRWRGVALRAVHERPAANREVGGDVEPLRVVLEAGLVVGEGRRYLLVHDRDNGLAEA